MLAWIHPVYCSHRIAAVGRTSDALLFSQGAVVLIRESLIGLHRSG